MGNGWLCEDIPWENRSRRVRHQAAHELPCGQVPSSLGYKRDLGVVLSAIIFQLAGNQRLASWKLNVSCKRTHTYAKGYYFESQ
eukprot:3386695-Amphidinium_carterae.1